MLWISGILFLILRKASTKFADKHKALKLVPFAFLALAVAALAYAPIPFFGIGSLGALAANLTSWTFGWLLGWTGASPGMIAAVGLLVLLLFGFIDLIKDLKPDGWAKWMVYLTPVLVLFAAGPIAPQVQDVITHMGGVGPQAVSAIA